MIFIVFGLLGLIYVCWDTSTKHKEHLAYSCPTPSEIFHRAGLTEAHALQIPWYDRKMVEQFVDFVVNNQQPIEPVNTTPIHFAEGEPQRLEDYGGQDSIVQLLNDAIQALSPEEECLRPQMFAGWAGAGKTLLAKVVANELALRRTHSNKSPAPFLEFMPVSLQTVEALDALMRKVQEQPGSVVFLDEIHSIAGKEHFLKFYQVLEEGRYKFESEPTPVVMPPTTYLSATTDYGALTEAFKRRWSVHFFQPSTREQILTFLQRRSTFVYPAQSEALDFIVERTYYSGAPWEALQIYQWAKNAALAARKPEIERADVQRVYELFGVDSLGLRHVDRQVIAGIFKLTKTKANGEQHYAGSESSVVNMARVDRGEFLATIRPRLLSRGLLEIRPYWGHTLTDKAVELYGALRSA